MKPGGGVDNSNFPKSLNEFIKLDYDKVGGKNLHVVSAKSISNENLVYEEEPFVWWVRPEREKEFCRFCLAKKNTCYCRDDEGTRFLSELSFEQYFQYILEEAIQEADDYVISLVRSVEKRQELASLKGEDEEEDDENVNKEIVMRNLSRNDIIDIANRVITNAYNIVDKTGQPVLSAFYPHLCSMNHSCQPNVSFMNVTRLKRDLHSIRDISKNEEIVINYFNCSEPWKLHVLDRRKKFYDMFKVVCSCVLCNKCDKCSKEVTSVIKKRCGKCFNALNCSKDCQVEHWKMQHKNECKYYVCK